MASPEFAVAVMLAVVVQISANLRSHPKMSGGANRRCEHSTPQHNT